MKFFMFLLFFVFVAKAQAQTYTNAPVNFIPITVSGSQLGGTTNLPSPLIPIGGGINPITELTQENQNQDAVPEPVSLIMVLFGIAVILILAPTKRKKV